ncbi:triose-phosphate isomerase [Oxyplasma meridianum]|uniref:Triose-phosphate isomerase n=1 Tax=Oxyplasma meridianum TaxID=3073602 RepID=A0AAX4NHM1_9ARCH
MGNPHTVIVNLKNYKESTGQNLIGFLGSLKGIENEKNVRIIMAVSPLDLVNAKKYSSYEIFSQTVDPVPKGAFTGKIPIEGLLEIDVKGSLVNHSENRIGSEKIESIMGISKKLNFETVICVESLEEARRYAPMKPEFIAYEPPELIGGEVSVTTAAPSIIRDVVDACSGSDVKVLVGAGVKNADDANKSIELGAHGVLIASGIVKSHDPLKSLKGIIQGITDSC